MIFIGGMGRSGSSVITRCLKNSGYNIGKDYFLGGPKYKSEYKPIKEVLEWLVTPGVTMDIIRTHQVNLSKLNQEILFDIASFALEAGVEVIKTFKLGFVLHHLKGHPIMEDPKFIIMHRDFEGAFNSELRRFGFSRSVEEFQDYLKSWYKIAKGYPTIDIDHKDVVNNGKGVGKRLSEFLGRDIDVSILSPKETFAATGVPH